MESKWISMRAGQWRDGGGGGGGRGGGGRVSAAAAQLKAVFIK